MTSISTELTEDDLASIHLLRKDIETAKFTASNIVAKIGYEALNAVKLGAPWQASKNLATSDAPPSLSCLIKLFVIGTSVGRDEAGLAFEHLTIAGALKLELISVQDEGFKAKSSITAHKSVLNNPGQTLWIVSDLDDHIRVAPATVDHVMGVGGATTSLLSAISSKQVSSAADVGTGNGVIALELAGISKSVVATDISARALRFARINCALNKVSNVTFAEGNLLEPLRDNRYELIVSNPPFVITPNDTNKQWQYRSGSTGGDSLFRQLLATLPKYLEEGGYFVGLGNWESAIDQDIGDLSSWVIARGSQSPLEYVDTWLRDGGVIPGTFEHNKLRSEWLSDFERREVDEITYGYVMMHKQPKQPAISRYEILGTTLGQNIRFGDAWRDAFESGSKVEAMTESELLDTTFVLAENVFEMRTIIPGTENIVAINLMRQAGIERQEQVGTVAASVAGAATGELTAGQTIYGLSEILDLPYDKLKAEVIAITKDLVWGGFIEASDAVE